MISVAVLIHLQRRLSTSPRLPRATTKKLLVLLPGQWDNEVMSGANALSRSLIYGRAYYYFFFFFGRQFMVE